MADPTPVLTPDRPGDALAYRPLSGLAIAGLLLSALYAAFVVISTAAALMEGTPFFLAGWMLLVAFLGAGLSLIAIWQIRTSEGTRAGLKIAQWGLWLSVLSALGYTAYATATAAAIKQQANRFLTVEGEDAGFFPLLEKGELTTAFLLTQTFSRRTGSNANDDEAMRRQFDQPMGPQPIGPLTQFLRCPLLRTIQQAQLQHGSISVEPGSVRGWSYEGKGYKVERVYKISTPECSYDITMTVQSTESDRSGEGRKWFVVWPRSQQGMLTVNDVTQTATGQKMRALRLQSRTFVDSWVGKMDLGQRLGAFLDTLEPKQRPGPGSPVEARVAALWWVFSGTGPAVAGPLVVVPPFIAGLDSEQVRRLFLPGYERFVRGYSYLNMADFRTSATDSRALIREDLELAFQEGAAKRLGFRLKLEEPDFVLWEMTPNGRLQIAHPFEIPLMEGGPMGTGRFLGRGRFLVDTAVPGDPRTTAFTPEWRMVGVQIDTVVPMPGPRKQA
jgi:hypothetical protein